MRSEPPRDHDAEAAFLGALMFNRGAFDLPSCALLPDDFYSARHRTVYEAALAMKADGVPVDYVTLASRLDRDGKLAEAGGFVALDKIAAAAPHAAHAPFYAAAVRAKSRQRHARWAVEKAGGDPAAIAAAVTAAADRFPELDAAGPDGAASVTLADLLTDYRAELAAPAPPSYFLGNSFGHLSFGPGKVFMLGGRPGAGKSALASQWAIDLLCDDPDARVLFCNVEMTPGRIRDRMLARLSGVPFGMILNHDVAADDGRVEAAVAELATFADRVSFLKAPFHMGRVAEAADRAGATVIVLDYLQRVDPAPDGRKGSADARQKVNAVMTDVRRHALDRDRAVLLLSALSRGRKANGVSEYSLNADLASFRESSELEYGVDDAAILIPQPDDPTLVLLRHCKCRDGEEVDVWLRFDGARMSFAKTEPPR